MAKAILQKMQKMQLPLLSNKQVKLRLQRPAARLGGQEVK